jgi:hypothetical protein
MKPIKGTKKGSQEKNLSLHQPSGHPSDEKSKIYYPEDKGSSALTDREFKNTSKIAKNKNM